MSSPTTNLRTASFVSLHGLSFLRCFTASLQVLFCLADAAANTCTTFSHNLAVLCVMMRFMFHLAFLHLQLQGFGTSAKPKNSGLCNQTLSPGGWGLGTRLGEGEGGGGVTMEGV